MKELTIEELDILCDLLSRYNYELKKEFTECRDVDILSHQIPISLALDIVKADYDFRMDNREVICEKSKSYFI